MEKTNEEITAQEVRCDYCGCAFLPEVKTEKDDEIEFSYFNCDYCGKAFMVCVTDAKFREMIYEYRVLAERNKLGRLSEEEQVRMQKLKEENIVRGKALMKAYIREDSGDGK